MNHRVECKFCGRYLMTAEGVVIIEQLPCPNTKCKAQLNIKIVTPDATEDQLKYEFKTEQVEPKGNKK